jgi:hypothetical protein
VRNYKVKGVRIRVFDPDDELPQHHGFDAAPVYRANALVCRVEVILVSGRPDVTRMAEAVYRHTALRPAGWEWWDSVADRLRAVPVLRLRAPA